MKLAPVVYFRVSQAFPASLDSFIESGPQMMTEIKVPFNLMLVQDKRGIVHEAWFFECQLCGNCGCPPFDRTEDVARDQDVPQEIVEHLNAHAHLYHTPKGEE